MNLLVECTYGKSVELVKEALRNGQDPTFLDSLALKRASQFGHTDIVEVLLQDGRADPASQDNHAISWASWNGHTDVVEVLLRDGRVEATDDSINNAATPKIKEMLITYKYRVDGKEYRQMREKL